ncbi:MAG: hypothetical protein OD815_001934 [Candidatus Alkanophagales archaeon MCA70_species_2]|nr:hypothetical protein [Candidatus Alkanophaga liquidiphilum]
MWKAFLNKSVISGRNSSQLRCSPFGSANSGHTATLRSAQISLRETSYVRQPLSQLLTLGEGELASRRGFRGG